MMLPAVGVFDDVKTVSNYVMVRNNRILLFHYWIAIGGVDSWLIRVLERAPESLDFHFAAHVFKRDSPLGKYLVPSQVHSLPNAARLPLYVRTSQKIVRSLSPTVVHSHNYHAGFDLFAAFNKGVKLRIAHSHSTSQAHKEGNIVRRIAIWYAKRLVQKYATHGLACSEIAAEAMFGRNWKQDRRWQVLHYGIDLQPFEQARQSPYPYREQLHIPESAFVIGNVARMVEEKNLPLFVRIAREYLRTDADAYFVLIGDGPLRTHIERMVASLGLSERFRFLGARDDVPQLMTHLLDLLLMPSHYEGLPVTVIEAQAAGLPAIVSQAVPDEALVTKEGVQRVNTGDTLDAWIHAIEQMRQVHRATYRNSVWPRLCASDFNIDVSASRLFDLYRSPHHIFRIT